MASMLEGCGFVDNVVKEICKLDSFWITSTKTNQKQASDIALGKHSEEATQTELWDIGIWIALRFLVTRITAREITTIINFQV